MLVRFDVWYTYYNNIVCRTDIVKQTLTRYVLSYRYNHIIIVCENAHDVCTPVN